MTIDKEKISPLPISTWQQWVGFFIQPQHQPSLRIHWRIFVMQIIIEVFQISIPSYVGNFSCEYLHFDFLQCEIILVGLKGMPWPTDPTECSVGLRDHPLVWLKRPH